MYSIRTANVYIMLFLLSEFISLFKKKYDHILRNLIILKLIPLNVHSNILIFLILYSTYISKFPKYIKYKILFFHYFH